LEGHILSSGRDGLKYHWELNGKNRKITPNEGFRERGGGGKAGGGKTKRKNLKFVKKI
jgi:hypothetical protein